MFNLLFADAVHIREQAKVDAARITQKSGNELRGSATALQQFSASLANKRRLAAAGSRANDISGNAARLSRSLTAGTLNGRIQAAEELGAVAAMAGAAGVGGASIDIYKDTVALHSAMREQAVGRATGEQAWAAGQQRGNAIREAVAGLDNNVYRTSLDYTQYIDHKKPGFLEQVVGIAGTVAATVYGGPQAGQVVMGLFEARQSMRNGDFAAGSQAIMGSIQNAAGAFRTHQALSPGPVAAPQSSIGGSHTSVPSIAGLVEGDVPGADRATWGSSFFNIPTDVLGSSVKLK